VEVIDRNIGRGYYDGTLGEEASGSSVHLVARTSGGASDESQSPSALGSLPVSFYLGNQESAVDVGFLRRHRVGCVVNCCATQKQVALDSLEAVTGARTDELKRRLSAYVEDSQAFYERELGVELYSKGDETFFYVEVPAKDADSYYIAQHFEECSSFVAHSLEELQRQAAERERDVGAEERGIGVLVHCSMGVNRSAAITGALLVRLLGCSAFEAVERMAKGRPIGILTNRAFLGQLQDFATREWDRNQQKIARGNACQLQ
jgi:hypothetical protein